jgi:hypothetical protein
MGDCQLCHSVRAACHKQSRQRSMYQTKSNPSELAIAALVILGVVGFSALQYMVIHHGKLPFV